MLPSRTQFLKQDKGFTLAELLIALAILGVIAAFAIPKLLVSQQNEKWKAGAKEFAGTISGIFIQYKQDGFPPNPLVNDIYYGPLGMTPYLNYVGMDTAGTIDDMYGSGTLTCTAGAPCFTLHSGAKIRPWNCGVVKTTANSSNMIGWTYDPDGGVTDGTTNGPGKAIRFLIFDNGRLQTYGTYPPGSYAAFAVNQCAFTATGTEDPEWFSW